MMKLLIALLFCCSLSYGQVTKYTVANCIIQGVDGKRDTVFNASQGNIFCAMDLDSQRISFTWDTKDIKTVKTYKILEKKDVKGPDYATMGVYAMKLKCTNRSGQACSVDFALNSRINNIQIVVVDGSYVVYYDVVQTQ